MREIKFRCWNACAKTMHDWQDLLEKNKIHLLAENKRSYPVMQYTGLKDKNGVEVYEGDIVEHYQNTFDVYYDESDAAFALGCGGYQEIRLCDVSNSLIKVIGNIYENPELLKD